MITWKLPFSLHIAHARVYIIDAEHKRLTEITPGQFRGYVPSLADCRAIGLGVCVGLNSVVGDGEEWVTSNE